VSGLTVAPLQVAVLSRLRHPNLVTLIGACQEAFGLVHEFLPNGSLEDRLAWQTRTKIICEMCSALIFLHSNKPHPVVHGDLTLANILLDANLVSKLGDFGLCQLLTQSNSNGELTPRCDVYSLGVIILRLLTGRPPQNIGEVVKDAMRREELHAVLDPTAGDWPFVQANQLAHIELRCAEERQMCRPDLAGEVWKVVEPLMKAASLTAGRLGSLLL
jgi:serine/threonine protein kinase